MASDDRSVSRGGHRPLRHVLQDGSVHFYYLALDTDDGLDIGTGMPSQLIDDSID